MPVGISDICRFRGDFHPPLPGFASLRFDGETVGCFDGGSECGEVGDDVVGVKVGDEVVGDRDGNVLKLGPVDKNAVGISLGLSLGFELCWRDGDGVGWDVGRLDTLGFED